MARVEPKVWALATRLRAISAACFLLHRLELLLEVLLLGEQRFDLLLQFAHGGVDLAGEGLDELEFLVGPPVGLQARRRPRCAGCRRRWPIRRRCGTGRSRPWRGRACRRTAPSSSRPGAVGLPPICTTRTQSPYFSPKNCMMSLRSLMSLYLTSVQVTGAFSRMRSLTSRSTSATCCGVSGALLKSNVSLSGPT